jgi:hypothetical protein
MSNHRWEHEKGVVLVATVLFLYLFPAAAIFIVPEVPFVSLPDVRPRAVVFIQAQLDAPGSGAIDAQAVVNSEGPVAEVVAETPAEPPTEAPVEEVPEGEVVEVVEVVELEADPVLWPEDVPLPEDPPDAPELPVDESAVAGLEALLDAGEEIEGPLEVVAVEDARAAKRKAERLARAKAAKAKSNGKAGKPTKDCEPDVPGVEVLGEDRFVVDRAIIDYYASHLKEASRLARIDWARDADGKVVGFKVIRIACGSVLHEAGFKNGDVILSINGRKVRSIPGALMAYRELRKKRRLQVEIERKGEEEPRVLRYRLT